MHNIIQKVEKTHLIHNYSKIAKSEQKNTKMLNIIQKVEKTHLINIFSNNREKNNGAKETP